MVDEDMSIRQPNSELHNCSPTDVTESDEGDDGNDTCMLVCALVYKSAAVELVDRVTFWK